MGCPKKNKSAKGERELAVADREGFRCRCPDFLFQKSLGFFKKYSASRWTRAG